jgi:photosystem II stability/assembly factor-like uncharacterized protein
MDHRRDTERRFRPVPIAASTAFATLAAFAPQACVQPISTNPPADAGPVTTGTTDGDMAEGSAVLVEDGAVGGTWTNRSGNLAGLPSQCGNLSRLFAKPDEDLLIASVALIGLFGSRDGGATWTALSPDAGPGEITNRGSCIAFDPTNSSRFWESGIYNGHGVFVTSDDGMTFVPLGSVTHTDCVSVDFTDANRKTLLAGGHEMAQTLNRSTDQGMTWTSVGSSLPPMTNCTFPLVIDASTHLVGCAGYGGGFKGVYRTTDGATTWHAVATNAGGSGPPLYHTDKSVYWASVGGGFIRSTDEGQTWTANTAASIVGSTTPIELPDGRVATIGAQSTIIVSSDHGATWKSVSVPLPFADPVGIVYSAQRKAFYTWHFTCGFDGGPVYVPLDAIMSFPFDYKTG